MKKKGNITLATLLLILCACQNNNETKDSATSSVKVKTIQVTSSVTYGEKQFSGTVEESNETALSFSVMGTVQSVCIKPGDHVKAGQLIASLDQTTISNLCHYLLLVSAKKSGNSCIAFIHSVLICLCVKWACLWG